MSSDASGPKINLVTLDGTNWNRFETPMKSYLRSHGCWFLIEEYGYTPRWTTPPTGTLRPTPSNTNAEEVAKWDEKNDRAIGLILLHLAEHIMHTVAHLSTAKAIWDELKRVYAKPGSVGAFVHFQQLFNSTLSDKSPLRPQLDAIQEFANRVKNDGIDVKDNLLALLMVNALPESYQSIGGTILATFTDISTLKPSDIIQRIHEEEQRRISNKIQISKVALQKHCDKCGKNNHTTEQHWPDGKRPTKKSSSDGKAQQSGQGNQGGQADQDGEKKKKKKKGKGKGQANANTIQANELTIVDLPSVQQTEPSEAANTISVSLYSLGESTLWMMDSGCTEHVTPFQSDFLWYHDFPRPGKAHLAGQGKTIDILGHGEVRLKHTTSPGRTVELTLRNVLYIPEATHRYFAPGVPHCHRFCFFHPHQPPILMASRLTLRFLSLRRNVLGGLAPMPSLCSGTIKRVLPWELIQLSESE